jgi:hypothetical protein
VVKSLAREILAALLDAAREERRVEVASGIDSASPTVRASGSALDSSLVSSPAPAHPPASRWPLVVGYAAATLFLGVILGALGAGFLNPGPGKNGMAIGPSSSGNAILFSVDQNQLLQLARLLQRESETNPNLDEQQKAALQDMSELLTSLQKIQKDAGSVDAVEKLLQQKKLENPETQSELDRFFRDPEVRVLLRQLRAAPRK